MTKPECSINKCGTKEWYLNSALHRLDGPALQSSNGTKEWWVDGKEYSKQDFPKAVIMFLLGCDKQTAQFVVGVLDDRTRM